MIASRAITSVKDIWWDIRPHPDYGTIELRICDGLPTLGEITALVALVHALCARLNERYAQGERPKPPPQWVLRENKWRASRWGRDADVVLDTDGRTRPLREDLACLIGELEPYAARVGAGPDWRRRGRCSRSRRATSASAPCSRGTGRSCR
jgi:carboxylate-amine ligase